MRNFFKDKAGNTAMMFGIMAFGVLGAVGYAIDYGEIRDGQIELQAQVDAAVLALGKSGADTYDEQLDIIMGSMLENGFSANSPKPTFSVGEDGFISINASTQYDTMVMGLFGKKSVTITASAQSAIAREATVEIVMVLDTTSSMAGTKIETLKESATDLVNTVAVFDDAEVKIGLVPFSTHVNVGVSNRNQPWIDVPADRFWTEEITYQPRRQTSPGTSSTCTGTESYDCSYESDGVWVDKSCTRNTGCTGATPATYVDDGPLQTLEVDHSEVFYGCVGSRAAPLNERDSDYATKIPGLMNQTCTTPLTPLTTNYGQLRNDITAMNASGNTYMPAGVAWGWRVLSNQAPFAEGVMTGADERKIMILMTDGINTMVQSGNNHVSTSNNGERRDTDQLTEDICTNAKNDGVEIFTVAFEVPDNQTKQMLEDCATSSDHYYDATSSAALVASFKSIAARITNVRLTR